MFSIPCKPIFIFWLSWHPLRILIIITLQHNPSMQMKKCQSCWLNDNNQKLSCGAHRNSEKALLFDESEMLTYYVYCNIQAKIVYLFRNAKITMISFTPCTTGLGSSSSTGMPVVSNCHLRQPWPLPQHSWR